MAAPGRKNGWDAATGFNFSSHALLESRVRKKKQDSATLNPNGMSAAEACSRYPAGLPRH